MAKIICILPESMQLDQAVSNLKMFYSYGFLNVAFAFKTDTKAAKFLIIGSLDMKFSILSGGPSVFRDKLRDMKGFKYQISVHNQLPRIIIGKKIVSSLVFLFEALQSVQNSNYQITVSSSSMLRQLWMNRMIHLTFNTDIVLDTPEPKLLTYETKGYCALVPLPPKTSIFRIIFVVPFDGLTWIFLALSVVSCVAVFWMFRRRGAVESPWLLGYGMFVYFIGQGVDFSRRNRTVLTILIQLIVLMIFVLSNAYEGVITSFMIQPIHENRLKTVEDLLASKYEIIAGEAFVFSVKDDQFLKSRLTITRSNLHYTQHTKAVIKTCDLLELELTKGFLQQRPMSDYFYILPESIFSQYVFLEASYLNPFLDRFQHYMDLSFNAGLPHMWKIYADQDFYKRYKRSTADDIAYLTLKDLLQVFSILIIGYVLSALILLLEIFLRDCLKDIKLGYLSSKLKNRIHKITFKRKPKEPKYQKGALYFIIHRHQKVKRLKPKRLKVRQIFVQPRNIDSAV